LPISGDLREGRGIALAELSDVKATRVEIAATEKVLTSDLIDTSFFRRT
jgi:hypothetical protein